MPPIKVEALTVLRFLSILVTKTSDLPPCFILYPLSVTGKSGESVVPPINMFPNLSINADLSTLIDSTFVGGSSRDQVSSIAIDTDNDIYIAGTTYSTDFPTT
ncbi:MAG: SBBP repeat-containing protein, partial [Nitrospirae bacterium]|nr:SBBP repeat-containing protein [Nitrospirota bacterium]